MIDSATEIDFLKYEFVVETHDSLIHEYGGLYGIRDIDGLLSGLSRVSFYHYYEKFEVSYLAAVYLHSINAGHLFIDGNKRTSLAVSESFLLVNGYVLTASSASLQKLALKVAKGLIDLNVVCRFFRRYAIAV